jgi:hypothetical protein
MHALPLSLLSTIPGKVVVYAPAKKADTLPLFLLYPFLLCGADHRVHRVVTSPLLSGADY